MAIPVAPFITAGLALIEKLFPDPKVAAEHKLKVLELEQNGEFRELEAQLQRDLAQIDLNKAEAQSTSVFKGGWRPMVGWICAAGLGYQFVFAPLVGWAVSIYAFSRGVDLTNFPTPPTLDVGTLMTLLFGMLGLGVYRTYERVNGKVPPGR